MTTVDTQTLHRVATTIARTGGHAVLVGGSVRDALLGLPPKDIDVEVFGLDAERLTSALGQLGPVKHFGVSFTVYQVRGLPIDFTLSRGLDFAEAARFRDLTINSMGRDILRDILLDPYGGQEDLRARRLRATDVTTFGDDPLRALRVCQLAGRFGMRADDTLVTLCARQDLNTSAGERLRHEFDKLVLLSPAPSLGLRIFCAANLERFFPALRDVDFELVDAAAAMLAQDVRPTLMYAALLSRASTQDAEAFLQRLRVSNQLDVTTRALLLHMQQHAAGLRDAQGRASWLLERALRLAASDVVLGRHLLARGMAPGEVMGRILKACRAYQDDTGELDAEKILKSVCG